MTMTAAVAQLRISRELADAEASLNHALLKQSQLFTAMLVARQETGVPPIIGQDALMRLARSQQTLLNAGNDLARVHGRLREIGQDLGCVRMADECPKEWGIPSAASKPVPEAA